MGSGFERGLAQSACQGPRWTDPGLPRHNDRSEIDSREYVRLSKIGDTVMSLKKIGRKRVVSLDVFLPDRLASIVKRIPRPTAELIRGNPERILVLPLPLSKRHREPPKPSPLRLARKRRKSTRC